MQHYVKGKGWRVLFHLDYAVLQDAVFVVREAGRQRCLREKKRNVHAYVEGTSAPAAVADSVEPVKRVSYNPYVVGKFMVDGEPIESADFVLFEPSGCYVARQ